MKIRKQATLLVIAVVATAVVAVGVTAAVTAGASTGGTTYYACIRSGKLVDVGVAAPSCPGGASQISWNSQGSAGPTGPQGPVGQASVVNAPAASDFAAACPQPPPPTSDGGTPSPSGVHAFLNIPGIPGESTDSTHTGQIDVLSWSFGMAGPTNGQGCVASHSSTGQGGVSGQQLSIVKNVDKASPMLMVSSGDGGHISSMTLSLHKGTSSADYLVFTFSNVAVTSVQWAHDGSGGPQEEATFEYGHLSVSYAPQNPDGTLGSRVLGCFDIDLQQSC